LVYGVAVAESSVSRLVGASASWIILAGASQLSLLSLIDAHASWPVSVGTALVINARFALYSTALAPSFSEFPRRWRWGLPYLMTDQAAAMGLSHFDEEPDPLRRRWFFLGAALFFATGWWVGTVAGVLIGASVPERLDIGFAVPAMFIALLVPVLTTRPAVVAAAVGGATTVVAAPLPNGLNIITGALVGIAVGRLAAGGGAGDSAGAAA
jgi:predicted branched-subunit amino acid permease